MKHIRSILFLIFGFASLIGFFAESLFASGVLESEKPQEKKVVIYTTKSFAGGYGPGPKIAERFKAKTGCEVEYVLCKEGVLNRAILEGKNTRADILLGIDNHLAETAGKAKVLIPYRSPNAHLISKDIAITDDWLLTPMDYGYLAFMFDTKSSLTPPSCLEDLTKPEYKGKIVIIDPRTNTSGLALAVWTRAVFGENYLDYWKKLKDNIFTMTPNWSANYDLFTSGEAPFAFSYTTSFAYHVLYDKSERFKPLIFSDGHVVQIEGMGLSAYAAHSKEAKLFIDFMLTEEAQNVIPETQFMYPVISGMKLPDSFENVPSPSKVLRIPTEDQSGYVNSIINVLQN